METIRKIMNDFRDLFMVNNEKPKLIMANYKGLHENAYNNKSKTNTRELLSRIFNLGYLIGQTHTMIPIDTQYSKIIKQVFTEPICISTLLHMHGDFLLLHNIANEFIPLIQLLNGDLSVEQTESQPFSFNKNVSIITDYINIDLFNQYVIGKYIEGLQSKQTSNSNIKTSDTYNNILTSIIDTIEDSSINNNYTTVNYIDKYTMYQQNKIRYNTYSEEYNELEKTSINVILKCLLINDALIFNTTGTICKNTNIRLRST